MTKLGTNASGAIWWTILQLMQVAPSGGQICNLCKWCHLVAKLVTKANIATWWPKLEPMLIALHVGQIWNQFWWHHLVVKFWTNTSGTTYNWPNLEPMQVAFYLAGEITQVKESIPWARCASGNVFWYLWQISHLHNIYFFLLLKKQRFEARSEETLDWAELCCICGGDTLCIYTVYLHFVSIHI